MKTKAEYAEYLMSDHWQGLRQMAIDRDGGKCTRCPSRVALQVHHVLYRNRWEEARLSDLVTLCRPCHEKEHGIVSEPAVVVGYYVSQIRTIKQLQVARNMGLVTREQFEQLKAKFSKPQLPKWVPLKKKLNRHQRRAKRNRNERRRRGKWSF